MRAIKGKRNLFLLMACLVAALLQAAFLLNFLFERPRDAALAAQFAAHKNAFEDLRKMLREDKQLAVAYRSGGVSSTNQVLGTCSLEEAGITTVRYEAYRAKLRECGAGSIIRDEDGCRFYIAGSGFASKGYRIAVSWRDSVPNPTIRIRSLDDFRKTTNAWEVAYRPLEGHWYLWIIW
jgi:hypothetical protein